MPAPESPGVAAVVHMVCRVPVSVTPAIQPYQGEMSQWAPNAAYTVPFMRRSPGRWSSNSGLNVNEGAFDAVP